MILELTDTLVRFQKISSKMKVQIVQAFEFKQIKKMKKYLLFILVPTIVFCQIKTAKVKTVENKKNEIRYDSLSNFQETNVECLINQTLYLKGVKPELQKNGYKDFFSDYKKDVLNKTSYKDKVYQCCDGINSKYNSLAGKYFKIISVIKDPKAENDNTGLYRNWYYLKLNIQNTRDTLYFKYSTMEDFPFIVEGYFKKLKKLYMGKSYVFGNATNEIIKERTDIETGIKVKLTIGEKWKCTDVIIDKNDFKLYFIISNNKQKIMLNYEDEFLNSEKSFSLFESKVADYYKLKFGTEYWNAILQSTIKLGMTKEMCKLSWGEPKSINSTIFKNKNGEQWVYSKNYIYFEKGIVTRMEQAKN